MKKLVTLAVMFLAVVVPQYVRSFELPCFNTSGVYVSTTAACNIIHIEKKHHVSVDLDAGYFLGAAVGYRAFEDFRVEAEFGYRNNHIKKIRFRERSASISFDLHGHDETFSGLANVYYDIPVCFFVKPYVGAGIGYAYTNTKVKFRSYSGNHKFHEDGFAWQVITGVAYPVCENTDLALEYRFFRCEASKRIQNHDIGLNLRYNF